MTLSRSTSLRVVATPPRSQPAAPPRSQPTALPQPRPQPHVQARLAIANWLWGVFVMSLITFTGTTLAVSLTHTGPVLSVPQPSQK